MVEENNLESLVTTHRTALGISFRLEQAKVKRVRIQPFIRSIIIQAATLIVQEEAQKCIEEGKTPLYSNATQFSVHVFEQFIMRYRPELIEKLLADYQHDQGTA